MQTGNTDFSYRNELDKACFQHDMAYGKSKDLPKRTQSDKVLRDKTFNIASDPKFGGYQRGLASMVYKFFDKKSSRVAALLPNKSSTVSNYQLASELHKQIIAKFKRQKVCLGCRFSWYAIIKKIQQRNQMLIMYKWFADLLSKNGRVVELEELLLLMHFKK